MGLAGGCANLSYDRVELGRPVREYERIFPEEKTRRTDTTIAYVEQDLGGRTDAMVMLLTRDRRVCAKLHAVHVQRNVLKPETGYVLRGEIDPELARYSATGPVDTLRAIADQLLDAPTDQAGRAAHAWVAAGVIRLLQRWPHVGDEGPAFPRVSDVLDRVPAGGAAVIRVNERGVFVIEYAQGVQP